MHISSVIKISFCRILFSGHQNKFCACLDSIYGSRVIIVMCKNCSDIRWHRLNLNQSKTNCPKNLKFPFLDWSSGKWVPGPNVFFAVCCNFLLHSDPPSPGYQGLRYYMDPYNWNYFHNAKKDNKPVDIFERHVLGDHFGYGLGQWEEVLHSNNTCH